MTEIERELIKNDWELLNTAFEALLDQMNVDVLRVGSYEIYRASGWGVGVLFRPPSSHEAAEEDDATQ